MQSRKLNRSILALGSLSLLGLPSLLEAQTFNRYAPAIQHYTPTTPYYPVPHYSVQPQSNSYRLPATPSVAIPQLVAPQTSSHYHPVPSSQNSLPNTITPQVNRPLESTNPGFQGRTLGTPGLITAGTVEQMERSGLVIEEFRPPQPRPEDLSLDGIPLEARQEFYRSLQLPPGSRIMSAQIVTGNSGASTPVASTPVASTPVASTPAASTRDGAIPAQSPSSLKQPGGPSANRSLSSPAPMTVPLPKTGTLGDPGIQPAIKDTHTAEQPKQREDVIPQTLNEQTELPRPKEATQAASIVNPSKQSTDAVATKEPVPVKPEAASQSKADPMFATLKVEKEQLAAKAILLTQELETAQKAIASREAEIKNLQEKSRDIQIELANANKQRAEMQESMTAMAENLQKQIKRLDESHLETARMLEKRTAEVSELQKQLVDAKNTSHDTAAKKPKKKKTHKDE